MSWSRPLVARTGSRGWGARQFTAPSCSTSRHGSIISAVCLFQKIIFPQSLPVTTYSELFCGPKRIKSLIIRQRGKRSSIFRFSLARLNFYSPPKLSAITRNDWMRDRIYVCGLRKFSCSRLGSTQLLSLSLTETNRCVHCGNSSVDWISRFCLLSFPVFYQ